MLISNGGKKKKNIFVRFRLFSSRYWKSVLNFGFKVGCSRSITLVVMASMTNMSIGKWIVYANLTQISKQTLRQRARLNDSAENKREAILLATCHICKCLGFHLCTRSSSSKWYKKQLGTLPIHLQMFRLPFRSFRFYKPDFTGNSNQLGTLYPETFAKGQCFAFVLNILW